MIINQYFGATQKISGSTYLQTKAILNVSEGFQGVLSNGVGVSTEYNNLGNFEVSDFNHAGGV